MELDNQKETYLVLLVASLEKKCELLEHLLEFSKEQEKMIKESDINNERFDQIIVEKDKLIQMVLQLDEGFGRIYQYVKEELSANQSKYKNEIQKLKVLITNITDKSVQIQAIEARNKTCMDTYFLTKRKEIKNVKLSSQTATSYYNNMADQYQQQAYFFDKKN